MVEKWGDEKKEKQMVCILECQNFHVCIFFLFPQKYLSILDVILAGPCFVAGCHGRIDNQLEWGNWSIGIYVIVARHHRRLNSQLIPLGEQFVELLVAHRR